MAERSKMHQTSNQLEAELIKLSFENMLVQWGSNTLPRTGLHASSVLVKDEEWCVRRHVLADLFPDQAVAPELQPWDWRTQAIFENGWDLHKRWQKIFRFKGRVVSEMVMDAQNRPIREYELDRTHFDQTRNIYFSPDAIIEFAGQRYVVEIKGIKQESFVELTDDLQIAMECCETVNKAVHQANLYMHLLELKKAIILVENKNTQEFKIWVIEYDLELVRLYIDRIYTVKARTVKTRSIGLSKLPARVCASRGDALARKCPMRDCCFSEKMEE
jgi:hypothetical protein